ncbi:hypothetical protein Lal_00013725 [Lupinus albus]|nr:hypothetical protein Lal_00013725 [Lupinus albus]
MNTVKPQQKEFFGLVGNKVTSAASNSLLGHNDAHYAPEEQMARLARFAGKGITPTAYTTLSWMTDSGFVFPEFLKNQGLQVFVELHGKMYLSLIREFYNNLRCKNGVYQTMVKNRFIILDEDSLVDVGGLARFDHPYGYFEEKLLNVFELVNENVRTDWPQLMLLNMLEFSTSSGALGYPILISRIIEHALVDLSDTGYLITDPQENFIQVQYIHFHLDIYKYDEIWTYFEDVDFYPVSNELPPLVNSSDEESAVPPVQYHALDEIDNEVEEEDSEEEEEEDPEENSDDE